MSEFGEPWTVHRCSYCEPDRACGFNGENLDHSYDECHHPLDLETAERLAACLNALANVPNPAGVPGLIETVKQILHACVQAQAQGWEDHSNFTQTLATALEACYIDQPPAASGSDISEPARPAPGGQPGG
jgi:hypothetical protein